MVTDKMVEALLYERQKRAELVHDKILATRDKIRANLSPDSPDWLRDAFDELHAAHHIMGGDPFDIHMRAALAHREAEAVAVKPLEWRESKSNPEARLADTPFDFILVQQDEDMAWRVHIPGEQHARAYDTREDAKAAAQADFERRIRSALVAPPAQEAVAWRPMGTAPKDASLILYANKFGEIGFCYWSEAGGPFDQSLWWDDQADDECCPVVWLPADTLPALTAAQEGR